APDVVLTPIAQRLSAIEDFAKEQIKNLVSAALGIDVDQLSDFIKHPTHWLNISSVSLTVPIIGSVTLNLFSDDQHAKLDGYLHLPPDHHEGLDISSQLKDDAKFDPAVFAIVKNTITMGKLLLLQPSELNHLLTDILRGSGWIKSSASVNTYPTGSNVMWYPLHDKAVDADPNTPGTTPGTLSSEPWLQLIDGDHSWRADGPPQVCYTPPPAPRSPPPPARPPPAAGACG